MSNRQYFVNLQTGGHMILDAKMGSKKKEQFREIVSEQGFEEVNRAHYNRLLKLGKIGERAVMKLGRATASE